MHLSLQKFFSFLFVTLYALFPLNTTTAFAQVATGKEAILEERYPQPEVKFAGGVTGLPDLTYSFIPGYRALKLDLYLPPGQPTGARPLVVYVAGGGWAADRPRNAGAIEDFPDVFAGLARKGYVVASIRYRLSGEAKFPAAEHDTKTALRWLRSQAAKYGIDKNRVVIWGSSAGGQLAGLAAVSCGDAKLAPPQATGSGATKVPEESDCVSGAAIWYGIFDFTQMGAPPPPPNANPANANPNAAPRPPGGNVTFLGCQAADCPDQARAASAVAHIDANDPPFLLIHGSADRVVNVKQSQIMHD
ncbi:MAG: alpha/beta hydrolase, partial [Acidobacteria bacterium]|nr:alpha/beta hydrolase [Acidobacteriota bacterium]